MAKIFRFALLLALTLNVSLCFAQKQKYMAACIAFYNLENLFDTIDSPNTDDAEFLPGGPYRWSAERYAQKQRNMASVIRKIGTEMLPAGPTLLGVCEIENRLVVEDLVKTAPLSEMGYGIAYEPSPDARGVGVALIYQQNRFRVLGTRSAILSIEGMPDFRTRNQLVVSGVLDGVDTLHVVVMHWPSKRGGEKRSKPLRDGAAKLCRSVVDSLYAVSANAKIILMGDFNDNPESASVQKVLGARTAPEKTERKGLYNTSYKSYREGNGSYAWNDSWDLIDQIIVSEPLLGKDYSTYKFLRYKVFNAEFLKQKDGRYAGYPWRTFSGTTFIGGYSDHFPTYIMLIRNAE
ncbi:MAG: endonuclease/exonuclease/phosphatase family protein [Prevotellaceae bacterium]|jgi:endonuclease/exonuclease/phosphatase family metal-dependent hydrolase|nr:endonuclease/exonuclease/phosphatase family protein [Prevotellaceae bacterium]